MPVAQVPEGHVVVEVQKMGNSKGSGKGAGLPLQWEYCLQRMPYFMGIKPVKAQPSRFSMELPFQGPKAFSILHVQLLLIKSAAAPALPNAMSNSIRATRNIDDSRPILD